MSINSLELIKELSEANGISGFEDDVLTVAEKFVGRTAGIQEDRLRNLFLHRRENTGKRPVVMIDGHSDEVGFMVQSITSGGLLRILPIGGWAPQTAMGQKVRVRNEDGAYLPGVLASKPPHFMSEEEKKKIVEVTDMTLDVGATSEEEIREVFRIEPGAPVVPDTGFYFVEQTGAMLGKAFDCRLGCAAVIETIHRLSNQDLQVDLVGTLSCQEEVGLRGAQVTARTVKPQAAIIFEGTPADDYHGNAEAHQGALKKGPQIRHRDRSMISHPRFIKFAREVARENGIPFQDAVRATGGTDGGMVHLAGQGIPTIVISIPVRYVHSPYGFATLQDYNHTVEWCCNILKKLDETIIDGF